MRVVPLVVRLVQGEKTADAEEHNGDDERVDVAFAAIPEGMLRAGLAARTLTADKKQDLVAGVRDRMDCFGEHQ